MKKFILLVSIFLMGQINAILVKEWPALHKFEISSPMHTEKETTIDHQGARVQFNDQPDSEEEIKSLEEYLNNYNEPKQMEFSKKAQKRIMQSQ